MRRNQIFVSAMAAIAVQAALLSAQSTTSFTYQGELNQNGNPANGAYNMEFQVWTALTSGAQLDSTTISGVQVADGRFSVNLDFGSEIFNLFNQNRFLQIIVNGTTLSPRSLISRTPYALQTRGIRVNDDASFVGIGRDTGITNAEIFGLYRNTTDFGGMYVETENNGAPFYGYATAGSVDAYHYYNSTLATWNLSLGGQLPLVVAVNGHVGVGAAAPAAPLHVQEGSAGVPAQGNSSAVFERSGQNFVSILSPNNTERGILFGDPENFVNGGIVYNNASNPDGLQFRTGGNVNRLVISSGGNVGIGTSAPIHPLFVTTATETRAITGRNTGTPGIHDGVTGVSESPDGWGINGANLFGGLAGGFEGDVAVIGHLTKSSGSFKIDHPLDPENRFLYHSFVESPEMLNIYNGNVITDENGYATVELPDWFEALNADFRYQLTIIDEENSDQFVLAKVVQQIEGNRFSIRTSVPLTQVSWLVTGVRRDPWAQANRIPVEVDKTGHEIGHYLHPEVYGLDRSRSMTSARRLMAEQQQAELNDASQ